MAGTNSDSVIWVAGETTGRNALNVTTTNIPADAVAAATSTSVAAPTASPTGSPYYVTAASGFYVWNGARWLGAI